MVKKLTSNAIHVFLRQQILFKYYEITK